MQRRAIDFTEIHRVYLSCDATPNRQDVCSLSRHILYHLLLSADPRRRDVGGQEIQGRIVGQRGGYVGREKHRTDGWRLYDDRFSPFISYIVLPHISTGMNIIKCSK